MEANFFRRLAAEVEQLVLLRRIEKIFSPVEDAWTFRLDNRRSQRFMIFRPAKSAGLFFFTDQMPTNPAQPPARAMWYRKRVAGRRILKQFVDWPNLRLAWELTPREQTGHGRYLVLSMRDDLALADELDPSFRATPTWPAFTDALAEDAWHGFPHLSPPLRHALKSLPRKEAAQLFELMTSGATKGFYLGATKNAFPLPWATSPDDQRYATAMDTASIHGERTLFPDLERQDFSPERARLKRARKKIRRALARLEQEKLVLDERRALKHQAEALQAEMYRLKGMEHTGQIQVEHPELGLLEITLDPRYSVLENMERFFKLAAKAERGYVHLARRRNELGKEMARLESASSCLADAPSKDDRDAPEGPPPLPKRYQGMAVTLFTSSDGMLIVRGRNKKANHQMLSKTASPFDWWFHAAQGPSAHVILKRDHPGQDVPERTLLEAATLCALKSSYRDAEKAEIMFALVKDVRKVKGWAHGQVTVDQVLGTVLVRIDPKLEATLARK